MDHRAVFSRDDNPIPKERHIAQRIGRMTVLSQPKVQIVARINLAALADLNVRRWCKPWLEYCRRAVGLDQCQRSGRFAAGTFARPKIKRAKEKKQNRPGAARLERSRLFISVLCNQERETSVRWMATPVLFG